MAGVAFAVEGDGVGFATESYAASALYTTLASLLGALWRIRRASYQRSQLSTQSDAIKNEIDPAFINDQYWLLLPLHVVWDGATVTDEGLHKLALGDASADRVVVKYPSDGGYEPGDTWDLYVGADKRIVEIAYHHGANKPPKLVIATWADHKKAGPLLVATDHRGTFDGKPLRVSISDVSVKVTGSENWINAQ